MTQRTAPAPHTGTPFTADAYAARQAARRARATYKSRSEVMRAYQAMSDRWNTCR